MNRIQGILLAITWWGVQSVSFAVPQMLNEKPQDEFRKKFKIESDSEYFTEINRELKSHHVAQPLLFIDLDRLDHNIETLQSHLKADLRFRVVDKSLPSVGLLKYILQKTNSHRIMTFHHPFIKILLKELDADTDILFGKPIPTDAIQQIYSGLSSSWQLQLVKRVQWLVDSPERLQECIDFFSKQRVLFRANIEIDVGLHRGGVTSTHELGEMLQAIRSHSDTVQLSGFMGYDGHVSHVPVSEHFPWLRRYAMMKALEGVRKEYTLYYDFVRLNFPELLRGQETWNGAGSETYEYYPTDGLIHDIAVGSALLMPKDFEGVSLSDHTPAMFIATPVLKRVKNARLPFIGGITDFIYNLFSSRVWGYYVYGGGWSDQIVFPAGIRAHPLASSTPMRNLISNQSLVYGVYGNSNQPMEIGDFIYYLPDESDTLFLFEDIYLIRNSKMVGIWHPFARRY